MKTFLFNKNTKIFKIIPAGIYNGFIWFLSSHPLAFSIGGFDKTAHLLEYSILGFLLSYGFSLTKHNFEHISKYCIVFVILLGAIDEFHQYFVPGRSCDIVDLFADFVGGSLGILIWLIFIKLLSFFKQKNTSLSQLEQ